MIKSEDISVVVQGAINKKFTHTVLKSIRKYLPNAQLILSTWEDSPHEGLDYDIIVKSKDPGAVQFLHNKCYHNLNRQIVSTINGVKAADRKYVLKIRTDISLKNANFLNYFDKFKARSNECNILKSRVLICNRFARYPDVFPFHISDWVFFGLKEDVENIWDIPLAPEPETTQWFENRDLKNEHMDFNFIFSFFRHRYCAEQYIWSSFLKKYINFEFEDMFDSNENNIKLTELSFANNLVILTKNQFGIDFLKGDYSDDFYLYDFPSWCDLYIKYCCKNIEELNFINKEKKHFIFKSNNIKLKDKIKKHYLKFISPIKILIETICELFSTIIYCIKFIFNILACIITNFYEKTYTKYGTELKIFGLRIYKDNKNIKTGLKQRTFLGINFPKVSISKFFDRILKDVPNDADDVYILRQSTGETYLLSNVINQWIKNNNSNNPYVIYTRKYHNDYFDLFGERIRGKFIQIPPYDFPYFKKNKYKYKNKNFYIYMDQKFLYGLLEKIIKNNQISFTDSIFKYLGVNNYKNCFHYPSIDEQSKRYADKRFDNKNFVYICTKSYTVLPVEQIFWDKLKVRLKEMDLEFIINNEDITIKQMIALAEKSCGIISVRTGLTECLTSLHKPMFVIYNKVPRFNANTQKAIDLYSLIKYPNVDTKNIFEYNIESMSYDEIIDNIVDKLEVSAKC